MDINLALNFNFMERAHSPLAGYREKRAKGGTNLSDINQRPKTPEEEFFGEDVDLKYETTAGEIHKKLDAKEAELKRQQEEIVKARQTKEQAKIAEIKAKSDAKTAKEMENTRKKLEITYNKNNSRLHLVKSEPDQNDQENFTPTEEKFFAEGKETAWMGNLGYELENDEPVEIKVKDLNHPKVKHLTPKEEEPRKAA